MRAGANEFLLQPIKRTEFRDAMGRLERAPRHGAAGESKLGKIYTFIGTKGGVGTTTHGGQLRRRAGAAQESRPC